MPSSPTLVFIPGSWHRPTCYNKVIKLLQDEHKIKCLTVTLPTTSGDAKATFKDDVDVARKVIISETTEGRDVMVVAHSYGGMVGNSSIKDLTPAKETHSDFTAPTLTHPAGSSGHVKALILIASGFTWTGWTFMEPLFNIPPPSWKVNKEAGFAELAMSPRELFYHDLPADEAAYWVSQLTPQSLKALFEGGEHSYAGWRDVPTWYIGTTEDRGLPVVLQRVQVGMARAQGAVVHHRELFSSHSPFLSMPGEVTGIIMEAVRAVGGSENARESDGAVSRKKYQVPAFRLGSPGSWFKFGIPLLMGHGFGWAFVGMKAMSRLWRRA